MESFIRSGGLPEFYRCEIRNKTEEEWYSEGEIAYGKGVFFIVFGLLCQIAYIPCLIVMTQRDIWHLPVYKILFIVTILDIISLCSDFLVTGFYFATGAVYCNHPVFNYIWGSICVSIWCGCCIGCFFLILTRIVDLMSKRWHDRMFGGSRIYFSIGIIIGYITFFIFYTRPTLFNSRLETWMWDPVIWKDGRDYKQFTSPLFVVNNFGLVMVTVFLTLAFFVIYGYKMKKTYDYQMDGRQIQLLLQSVFICLCDICTAVCYTYIQFVDANPIIVTVALIAWQLSSVSGLFVFYVMNKSVRRKIFALLKINSKTVNTSSFQHKTTLGHIQQVNQS